MGRSNSMGWRVATAGLVCVVMAGVLGATAQAREADDVSDEIVLSGIVHDRTLTPTGREFYREFSSTWLDSVTEKTRKANLIVTERPTVRGGSLVAVELERRPVFQLFLTPRRTDLEPIVESAIERITQQIVLRDLERQNSLAGVSDMYGDGY